MLPTLVAHADWGSHPRKRWLARAVLTRGRYVADAPSQVAAPEALLARLAADAPGGGPVLVGFDFPIGLPAAYAARAGIKRFQDTLPSFGGEGWAAFYTPAGHADDIGLTRPFYPARRGGRGEHAWRTLADRLGVTLADLWRRCDRAHPGRRAACPVFWTLGPQQAGKAAISGWRDVLAPALRSGRPDVVLWPFAGALAALLRPGRVVVAETYPAEIYRHLGVVFPRRGGRSWGKQVREERQANAEAMLEWAAAAGVTIAPRLRALMRDGFGRNAGGDDPFDATVGVMGLLDVALGRRASGEPSDQVVREVEGWIIGQAP